ncbi:MAG: hypothetical protein IJH39_02740 [Clostridia bacterium]|nr:hypothetical protein [Clostridia bacterium]
MEKFTIDEIKDILKDFAVMGGGEKDSDVEGLLNQIKNNELREVVRQYIKDEEKTKEGDIIQ